MFHIFKAKKYSPASMKRPELFVTPLHTELVSADPINDRHNPYLPTVPGFGKRAAVENSLQQCS